eukprot:12287-Heterococcus_DN1.PRE.5
MLVSLGCAAPVAQQTVAHSTAVVVAMSTADIDAIYYEHSTVTSYTQYSTSTALTLAVLCQCNVTRNTTTKALHDANTHANPSPRVSTTIFTCSASCNCSNNCIVTNIVFVALWCTESTGNVHCEVMHISQSLYCAFNARCVRCAMRCYATL